MTLGFTSHYQPGEQPFGSLTQTSLSQDVESTGTVASELPSLIVGSHNMALDNDSNYDSCDFSVAVDIDYSQYTNSVASNGSSETAGSVAYVGGSDSGFVGASTVSSGASGGCASFSGGGGMSCASFTC